MKKVPFVHMVRAGIYKFKDAFDVFDASFFKVFTYFVFINLMMLLPLSLQIVNMENFDYERYGMNFTTTEIPEWIPEYLPTSCRISGNELDCGTDEVYEFTLENRDKEYTVLLNVSNDETITADDTIVFYQDWIDVRVRGSVIRLTYSGFNGTNFADFHEMTSEEAASILFENFFQSLKKVIVLPLMIVAVGALFLMNFLLVVLLAAISMLFKLNQSEFPSYNNMIKLFMIASTIPAIINVFLGFLGLSAFTSLTYNFITPILALLMYRASRRKLMINS